MRAQEYWESVYAFKGDRNLSWTQPEPLMSLSLIGEVCAAGHVIDVGGRASRPAERLLERGYSVTYWTPRRRRLTGPATASAPKRAKFTGSSPT